MAIIKCKMCGGDIVLAEDKTYGTCEYCGSTMTFPKVSDEQRLNLFNRANHFRRQNEFDKAIAAYDKILDQDDTDAEAHWGAVLSRYGIEYVEDPVTHERIPTCHRVQLGSILTDADYLAALEHAPDTRSRDIYESEAKRIAEIQKGILAISAQEKPYDVFICYKETDDSGSRTKDSTLAQDIYYQLTNEGYKVFFSRITLEDKLGQQYEPYIFAALNSAKVMLVIGTKAEYFNAVWVKNEWNRYLDLMKRDRSKLLIPCYRDMDPYDLPEELSALQSQDMGKIGFIQDIIRGVKKVLNAGKEDKSIDSPAAPGVASLHKRAVLFLEDGDWESANEYFNRILDIDPEFAPAYIGKVQTKLQIRKEEGLARCAQPLKGNPDYQKALRFADEQHKAIYEGYNRAIEERLELERKEAIYREADALEKRAAVEADFIAAAKKYDEAGNIRDAKQRAANCRAKGAAAKKEADRKAEEYRIQLEKEREARRRKEEEERAQAQKREEQKKRDAEHRAEQERIEAARKKKRNRNVAIIIVLVMVLVAGGYAANKYYFEPQKQYKAAEELLEAGNLQGAVDAFAALNGYRDSEERIKGIYYDYASQLLSTGKLADARSNYLTAEDFSDAAEQIDHIDNYLQAEEYLGGSDYLSARPLYVSLGDFLDAPEKLAQINETLYGMAAEKKSSGDISGAYEIYSQISDYSDSAEIMAGVDADYQTALDLWESGDKQGAEKALTALIGWSDVSTKLDSLREEIADEALDAGDYDTALDYFGKIENASDEVSGKIEQATQAKAYNEAIVAFDDGDLETALSKFELAGNYDDAATQTAHLNGYLNAVSAQDSGDYDVARSLYASLGDYLDAETRLDECNAVLYDNATAKLENGDVEGAYELFGVLSGYSNSAEIVSRIEADYSAAAVLLNDGKYDEAVEAFTQLNNYSDSETQINECKYQKAGSLANSGNYGEAADIFDELAGYRDSSDKANEAHYNNANALWTAGDLQAAAEEFKNLGDYSDAPQQLVKISTDLADYALANGDYASALTAYLRLEQTDEIKTKEYELAQACYDDGHYAEATSAYEALGQYELSLSKLPIARYAWADQLFNDGSYAEAAEQFTILGEMTDSTERAQESTYLLAKQQLDAANYDTAKEMFKSISGYNDADALANKCDYRKADELLTEGCYTEAQALFEALGKYSNSATKAKQCVYRQAEELFAAEDYAGAQALYATISYSDSADKANQCVYNQAQAAYAAADYATAKTMFASINYDDSADKANMSAYAEADASYKAGDYAEAETLFGELGEYDDSADRAKDSHLQQGVALMEAGDYEEALGYLETVDYSNSAELAAKCHYEIGHAALTAGDMDMAMAQYALASELPEAQEALMSAAKDYASINEIEKAIQMLWIVRENESAITMLSEIGDLKNQTGDTSKALLAYCAAGEEVLMLHPELITEDQYISLQGILDVCSLLPEDLCFVNAQRYAFASSALSAGNYDLATDVFTSIKGYSDSEMQSLESQYQQAAYYYSIGEYESSYDVYTGIVDYKDVGNMLANDSKLQAVVRRRRRTQFETVGNTVLFGQYEQDNNTSNGKEPIEWIVLAVRDNQCLLISKMGLDAQQYSERAGSSVWETSSIRQWLNDSFYKEAFNNEEKLSVTITSLDNQTDDRLFLLSEQEAYRTYFNSDEDRVCIQTAYALSVRAAHVKDGYITPTVAGPSGWMLRGTPTQTSSYVPLVCYDGGLGSCEASGAPVRELVRPALWLDLDSISGIDAEANNPAEQASENNSNIDDNRYDVLLVGSKGETVKRLQQSLIDKGFLSGKADGDFGNMTAEAVKKAQEAFGMEQTGIADDALQKKLYGE